ncbi:hypothetical protein [Actinosynnema sp. NPDC020468]|uniref:hypothetical protein n=1 Tax=Actinosynnema sp. NPDC020468 TaxID=3154488 RepID=UPI0033F1396C
MALAYRVSALLLASGLFHVVVFLVDGGPWEGPVSWRKPITFGLSFGLTLATYAWVAGLLRARPAFTRLFTAVSVLEVGLITLQAWRGVPSHFNEATTFDTVVTRLLTVGGITIVVCVVALAVAAFRAEHLTPSMTWAVRVGTATFLLAMASGGLMVAERGGSWKLSHGVAMHGVLLLPLFAWALGFTSWDERRRTRAVRVASGGYLALVAGAVALNAVLR